MVSLSSGCDFPITIPLVFTGAEEGVDYSPEARSCTLPAQVTRCEIQVDALSGAEATLNAAIDSASFANVNPSFTSAQVSSEVDNIIIREQPVVSFRETALTMSEGEVEGIVLERVGDGAMSGNLLANGVQVASFAFGASDSSVSVGYSAPVTPNLLDTQPQALSLSGLIGGVFNGVELTVTVAQTETQTASVTGAVSGSNYNGIVTLGVPSTLATDVTIATSDVPNGAIAGIDYEAVNILTSIPAGARSVQFQVPILLQGTGKSFLVSGTVSPDSTPYSGVATIPIDSSNKAPIAVLKYANQGIVADVNDRGTLAMIADTTIADNPSAISDFPITIELDDCFVDLDGDQLTYSATLSGGARAFITGSSMTLQSTDVGDSSVTVTASDGVGIASFVLDIISTLTDDNRLPLKNIAGGQVEVLESSYLQSLVTFVVNHPAANGGSDNIEGCFGELSPSTVMTDCCVVEYGSANIDAETCERNVNQASARQAFLESIRLSVKAERPGLTRLCMGNDATFNPHLNCFSVNVLPLLRMNAPAVVVGVVGEKLMFTAQIIGYTGDRPVAVLLGADDVSYDYVSDGLPHVRTVEVTFTPTTSTTSVQLLASSPENGGASTSIQVMTTNPVC